MLGLATLLLFVLVCPRRQEPESVRVPLDPFGSALDLRGDVDGDGCADPLLGSVVEDDGDWGVAYSISSGRTGALLHSCRAGTSRLRFPSAPQVRYVGDLDHDGADDVGVCWPALYQTGYRLQLRSGKSGRTLQEFRKLEASAFTMVRWEREIAVVVGGWASTGREPGLRVLSVQDGRQLSWLETPGFPLPASLITLGDLDLDGREEVVAGHPVAFPSHQGSLERSTLVVRSTRDGRASRLIHGARAATAGEDGLGAGLQPCGDFDGDGREDFLALSNGVAGLTGEPDYVQVFSAADGRTLCTYGNPGRESSTAYFGAPVGDIDADGRSDILVGRNREGDAPTELLILGGGAGRELLRCPVFDSIAGIAGGRDADGDGKPDFLVGWLGRGLGMGHVELRSGTDGRLIRSIVQVPLEQDPGNVGK